MSSQEFLFTLIIILIGVAITQLLKGQTLLLRDYFHQSREKHISKRWAWRLLWSINLTLIVIQYTWGFRLEIDKITNFWHFLYFISIPALIYASVNYIFPENIETLYKSEENEENEDEKKKKFLGHIRQFYFLCILWIISTIPANIDIRNDKVMALNDVYFMIDQYEKNTKGDTLKSFNFPNAFNLKRLHKIGLHNDAIKYLKVDQSDLEHIGSKNINVSEIVIEKRALYRKVEKLSINDYETTVGLVLKAICMALLLISLYQKYRNKEKSALTIIDFVIVAFSILMILYYFYIRAE
jgi:hypothetical protein